MTTYLQSMPTEIPRGQVLVHNSARPTRHLGARGFRAWLQVSVHGLELCPCDWSGLEHYCVTPREPTL